MESFDNFVKEYTTWLDNPYVSGALIVFLVVYAAMAAPRLPNYIAKLFDYTLFKLFIFFLIVYVSKKNATVALVASVALMVSLMALDKLKLSESMEDVSSESEVKSEESKIVLAEAKRAEEQGALSKSSVEELVRKLLKSESEGKSVLVARTEEGVKMMEQIAKAESEGKLSEENALRMVASVVVREAVLEEKLNSAEEHPVGHPMNQSIMPPSGNNVVSSKPNVGVSSGTMTNVMLPPSGNIVPKSSETVSMINNMEQAVKVQEARQELRQESSQSGTKSIQELAQEVLKIKQEESRRRGGESISSEELRRMCAVVLDQYRSQAEFGRNCGSSCSCGNNSEMISLSQTSVDDEVNPHDNDSSSYASF